MIYICNEEGGADWEKLAITGILRRNSPVLPVPS